MDTPSHAAAVRGAVADGWRSVGRTTPAGLCGWVQSMHHSRIAASRDALMQRPWRGAGRHGPCKGSLADDGSLAEMSIVLSRGQ